MRITAESVNIFFEFYLIKYSATLATLIAEYVVIVLFFCKLVKIDPADLEIFLDILFSLISTNSVYEKNKCRFIKIMKQRSMYL